MRFVASATARGVSPERALTWWSDFQPGRSDHDWLPLGERRILGRHAGMVTMEDQFALWREVTTAHVDGNRVRFRGENNVSRFTGSYAFEAEGDGTRVSVEADVHLKPALRWSERAAYPIARRIVEGDLRHHVRDMEKELRG